MKKLLPIILIIVVIAVLGVGSFVLLASGKITLTKSNSDIPKTITSQIFSGTLKMAVEKGIALKCSYKLDENNFGTGYLKGKNYAGSVTTNGQEWKILIVENCMYTWNENAKQAMGSKICFESTSEKSVWDQQGVNEGNYNCSPSVVSDEMFKLPTDIKFMNVGMPGGTGE